MIINFVLPPVSLDKVVGGYRVHYEYANRLAQLGHSVMVTHMKAGDLASNSEGYPSVANLSEAITWFAFSQKVILCEIAQTQLPQVCDVLVCTAWQTAERFGCNHQIASLTAQIAYDYEFWMTANAEIKNRMQSAFLLPDLMISGSGVVTQMLNSFGRKVDEKLYCGIDQSIFQLQKAIDKRSPVIGILLRDGPTKRVADAIAALEVIRKKWDILILAAGQWLQGLPDWIIPVDTHSDQLLNDFYNRLSIFILPSQFEGWGLPAIEAMAGGACVISAHNGGIADFLIHEVNSLLYEPCQVDQLIMLIDRLLEDDELRARLAINGHSSSQVFSWEKSVHQLEQLLQNKLRLVLDV